MRGLLLTLVVVAACAAEAPDKRQLSKPLSVFYKVPGAHVQRREWGKDGKKRGSDAIEINEARGVTKADVRGKIYDLVEGDIVSSRIERIIDHINSTTPLLQKASSTGLWPRGRIPYVFATSITGYKKDLIKRAMEHWASQTCVTFVAKEKADRDYVLFYNGGGCFSDMGRLGGKQVISIGPKCVKLGVIIHEIGHTTGFYHEQSRPDRDKYVMVKLQNARPGTSRNFAKYSRDYIDTHGIPYDYGSIMHYRANAFSVNGQPTIVPIVEDGEKTPAIGQRIKLSQFDIDVSRSMYNCDVEPDSPPTTATLQSCEDQSTQCRTWADLDFCVSGSFVVFMSQHCQISCGICKPLMLFKQGAEAEFGEVGIQRHAVTNTTVSLEVQIEGALKIHIMYREAAPTATKWGYGLYRNYVADSPVYTIYNLQSGTGYEFVARYTVDGEEWSEFSDPVTVKTRRGKKRRY